MKLLITAEYSKAGMEELTPLFQTIDYQPWTNRGKGLTAEELCEKLSGGAYDALITELDEVSGDVLRKFPKLKFIGDCRGNPTNIDLQTAKELGIPVFCTPARNAQAVSEMLVGMMLSFYRNIPSAVEYVDQGKWIQPPPHTYYKFQGNELCGKKVGFVGLGAIGRKTARIISAFDTEILYYDPYVLSADFTSASLDRIFTECDIISIHLPVTDETRGMIGVDLLTRMKKTAVFVNTARSAVIDSECLYDILASKSIKGAVLDVLDHEPPNEDDLKLVKLPNVLVTPHICGATFEVVDHQSKILNDQIKEYFALA